MLSNQHGGLSEYLKLLGYRRFHYFWWPRSTTHMTVLLHGLGECADTFGPFASRIRRSSEVIAMDLRGHGGTPWDPDGEYQFDDYADDLRLQLEYWQKKAVLVGTGLGALLAIRAAERWPGHVAGLVLLGPPPDDIQVAGLVELVLGPAGTDIFLFGDHPSMRSAEVAEMLTWARPDGLRAPKFDPAAMNIAGQPGLTENAGPRTPTLVVLTGKGGPGEWPNWPDADQVIVSGSGNWPHIANPAGAADAVNAFLDDVVAGDAAGVSPDLDSPRGCL